MAQYTLDGNEKKIELVGYYASIKNNSAATIYASQSAGIDPNGENVTPIQAGESVSIPTNADKCIYLLGSGKVAIISGNEWQNFFKSAPAQGGGGTSGGVTQQQLEETLELYATNQSVSDGLAGKVDAVVGKGLSSNDYTDEDKAKIGDVDNLESEIADLKGFIGYTDSDIYGLEADFENNVFTRLAGAVGKSPGADFDNIQAFGGRKRCAVALDGTVIAYYGEEKYEEDGAIVVDGKSTYSQVMVKQPKFYYKMVPLKLEKIEDTDGYKIRKARYYISDTPKPGFKVHPAFICDGAELDYVYMSAYECCTIDTSAGMRNLNDAQTVDFDADWLMSCTKAKPTSGLSQTLTRSNARKLVHNIGTGWDQAIIQTISATQLLFLIEYGTFNSQTAIGIGVTNKAPGTGNESEKTGATSSLGNMSGSVTNANGYNVVSYRGEENPWGNIMHFVDGINIENPTPFAAGQVGTVYVADHDFADDTKASPYKNTGIHPHYGNGYISAFGYSEEYDWMFIPAEYIGNSSLPVGDYFWNSNYDWRVAILGGTWADGAGAGAFCCTLDSSGCYRSIGARLIYRPTPAQEVSE